MPYCGPAVNDLLRPSGLLAPAGLGVLLAHGLDVRRRSHGCADLHLPMTLDRRLRGAAVFLAPYEADLGARLRIVGLQHRDREHLALVRAVADPGRHADGPAGR